MSSAGGLSRRRVAGASSSNSDDTPSLSLLSNGPSSNGTIVTHAGSAFEGGSKIACDPRDLDQVQEDSRNGGKMPRLTIMEEVLLLGLKDKHVCMAHFYISSLLFSAHHFCMLSAHSLRLRCLRSMVLQSGYTASRCLVSLELDNNCILVYHALTCSSFQGYLSFWNDSISYALRGCILIELALRRRIALVKDSGQRRSPLADRLVEVIDDKQTGETILDEALKMMKGQESDRMSINGWVDLLSGAFQNFCMHLTPSFSH